MEMIRNGYFGDDGEICINMLKPSAYMFKPSNGNTKELLKMTKLTAKRKAWIEEYLQCWNATEAARRVGFTHPNTQGPRLLLDVGIQEIIKARLDKLKMGADEVLIRLAEHARGDIGDFMDIESMSFDISLKKAKEKGITHLIKKIKQRTVITQKKNGDEEETHYIEIELHDSQAALDKLARAHGLYRDRLEIDNKVSIIGLDDMLDKVYGSNDDGI